MITTQNSYFRMVGTNELVSVRSISVINEHKLSVVFFQNKAGVYSKSASVSDMAKMGLFYVEHTVFENKVYEEMDKSSGVTCASWEIEKRYTIKNMTRELFEEI